MKKLTLLIALVIFLSSCSFFRVVPHSIDKVDKLEEYEKEGKYMVLHRDLDAWHVYDLRTSDDSLFASINVFLGYHANYIQPDENKLNVFVKKNEPDVVNSMHIYTSDSTINNNDTLLAIPRSKIIAVKSFEYARGASLASVLVPVITLGVAGTALILYGLATAFRNSMSMSVHI